MDKETILKVIGYIFLIILLANIILFSFRIISWQIFWLVLGMSALVVYGILPRIKKK